MTIRPTVALACIAFVLVGWSDVRADDWPEFRGEGRRGVWHETGIVEEFPAEGVEGALANADQSGAGTAVAAAGV